MWEKLCQINGICSQSGIAPWKEGPSYSLWAPTGSPGPDTKQDLSQCLLLPSSSSLPFIYKMRGVVLKVSFLGTWSLTLQWAFAERATKLGPGLHFLHPSIHSETRLLVTSLLAPWPSQRLGSNWASLQNIGASARSPLCHHFLAIVSDLSFPWGLVWLFLLPYFFLAWFPNSTDQGKVV